MDYEKLLKKGREQLPKEVFKKERWEIPKINSVVIGSRTVIKNFYEAAKDLRREPQHLLKFLSKELASPGNIEGREAIFQGKFSSLVINKKLDVFVKTYVFCPGCGKPDTKLNKDERILFIKCEACGARKSVPTIK